VTVDGRRWGAFRVTIFRYSEPDEIHEFASVGRNAKKKRNQWLHMFSSAVSGVTRSLFPPHVIMANPLPHTDATSTRILAGYLLLCEASDCVALLYCELRSYSHGEASIAVYTDELCEVEVAGIQITEESILGNCSGISCNIFGISKLRFCARTRGEAELWIRAIMNIKTKLLCDAPDPTADELAIFRESVLQRVTELPDIPRKWEGDFPAEAMLPLRSQQPITASLLGDDWPVDSESDLLTTASSQCNERLRETFASGEPQKPHKNRATIDCQVVALIGVAAASLVEVANEFSEGDIRPCTRLSRTRCWFGSTDEKVPGVLYASRGNAKQIPVNLDQLSCTLGFDNFLQS